MERTAATNPTISGVPGRPPPLRSPRGPLRRDDRPGPVGGADRDRSLRRVPAPAVQRRRAGRPPLPRVPQQPLPLHRREAGAGGADRARPCRGRHAVRAQSGRVRPRLDARADPAAGRSRGPIGRDIEFGPPRSAHPLHRRLHRPRLGRARDARALERGHASDHDLPGDEDRAGLLHADDRAGRHAVRFVLDRLEIQGAGGTDAEPLLQELRVTVLVTGGTGFVGHHVVHALRARNVTVRALVRDPRRARRLSAWGAELVRGDVADQTVLRAACVGVQAVIHLVAIIKGSRADFERVMEHGTRNLVAAAEGAGIRRFVLASALGLDERSKDAVPYFTAKWEMERAVRSSSLGYVVFRPSFIFGEDGGVLPTFVRLARLAPVTPIVGDGKTRLQPIWIEDVAEYYARAIDHPAATGRVVEIGGPEAVTWNDFWDRLKRIAGARRPPL